MNGFGGITIGNHVLMGPEAVIYTSNHSTKRTDIPIQQQGYDESKPVVTERTLEMKKIALMIPNLQSGGSERIVSRLSVELGKYFEVFLILFDSDNISYEHGGTLISLDIPAKNGITGKIGNILKRILKIRKIIKDNNIDITLSFTSAANNALALSFAKCKKIISCRGYNHLEQNPKLYKLLCSLTDGILFNSKAQKEFYYKNFPKDKDKLYVLYNLFDNEEIEKKSKEPLSTEEQSFFDSHKVITTVSQFSYDKGQWNLLKAFELLKEEVSDAGLVFVGHRGTLKGEIADMAEKSKYKDDILFVGFQKNPFKYAAKSDVYALCSLTEGFPNALVEAMIVKTKVVATDCKTGPSEVLFENYNPDFKCEKAQLADYGIISPAFDKEADFDYNAVNDAHLEYKNALKTALNDYDDKIIEKAYEKCREYDSSFIINEYINFIERINK